MEALRNASLVGFGVIVGLVFAGTGAFGQRTGATLETLIAKDAIREQLYSYGRGLDRMDRSLALQPYHADATVGGAFKGTGEGWIDQARRTLERETSSSHQMTNMLINVTGATASSETYFIVSQHAAQDAGATNAPHTSLVRGRYIDTWARRDGKWGITHREIVVDFSTNDMTPAPNRSAGRRDKTDPSYTFFK
jgi:hypothetical protein